MVFGRDGTLFISVGDRFDRRNQAQLLDSDLGKIVRIRTDGSIPNDNPFVNRPGARPEIWSLGHRNAEGLAINPATGELWEQEHGAKGGDEINIIKPGHNYGWPVITYGLDYSGARIGVGTAKPGMDQPIYYWDPSIAPSGMNFYTGELFPAWKGSLFNGALKAQRVVRLALQGNKVVGEEDLLGDLSWRKGEGHVLLFNGYPAGEELGTLLDVLASSAEYWAGRGKPFFAVFVDPDRKLALPDLYREA